MNWFNKIMTDIVNAVTRHEYGDGPVVKKQTRLTEILILTTIVVWVGFDFWTYFTYGNPSTISAIVWEWSWHLPCIPLAVGVLIGHLFFQNHEGTIYSGKPK